MHNSDTDLSKKITEILNIYKKNSIFKGSHHLKYRVTIAEDTDTALQKQQDNQNNPQKYKEPNKSFYQYMKKDQNLPNKNFHSNNSSGKPLPSSSNQSRNQSLITTEVDHQIKEIHEIPHKKDRVDHIVELPIIEIIIHDQTQTD